jgi:hypothetical protein
MRDPGKREASIQAARARTRIRENAERSSYYYDHDRPETVVIDGEPIAADDRDSRAFKAYVAEVEKVLKEADGALMTIREIKAALGDRLVERWIFDALATSYHVLHVRAYIDRFAYVEKLTVKVVIGNNNIQLAGTRQHKRPDWQYF